VSTGAVITGAAADTLTFNHLDVRGATTLLLGNGDNSVTIDDSAFVGKFTLTTGSGMVSLDFPWVLWNGHAQAIHDGQRLIDRVAAGRPVNHRLTAR
jgi:hypothetical protein